LIHRIASAQAVKPQRPRGERDLSPDEPVRPVRIDGEGVAEQRDRLSLRCSTEVHEAPARETPRIEFPNRWERPPETLPQGPRNEGVCGPSCL